METLGKSRLRTFLENGWQDRDITNRMIRQDRGLIVTSFPNLVERVASLAYHNRDQVLLFRGQGQDYPNRLGNTTIQPAIFRPLQQDETGEWMDALRGRYSRLKRAEGLLVQRWADTTLPDQKRIQRHRNLRWAILQHYLVCPTPLLDVTHSLRVAASFAADASSDNSAMLYVIAVPQISGAITASAEAEVQILRLSSICPPTAKRPHFQEGYLLGHYPDLQSPEDKEPYELYEVDFGRRLLCKFRLDLRHFWRRDFPFIPHEALYPQMNDPLLQIAEQLKNELA
jgi:hypothetical protein